jgi:hypothetical protein
MAWEPFSGAHGTLGKVLARDANNAPEVFLVCVPAGTERDRALPYRQYHRTVRESSFTLAGDLSQSEYADENDEHGTLVTQKPGYFVSRAPGAVHGWGRGPVTVAGYTALVWRTGPGTWPWEGEYSSETMPVPFSAGGSGGSPGTDHVASADGTGIVIDREGLAVLDTRAMDWEEFPGMPGFRRKVLRRDEEGEICVFLAYIPPEFALSELPHRHYHRSVRELAFFLEGEFSGWEYESAAQQKGTYIDKKAGFFIDRLPGSIHGEEDVRKPTTGCVLLHWRVGGGNYIGDSTFDDETVTVPYGTGN